MKRLLVCTFLLIAAVCCAGSGPQRPPPPASLDASLPKVLWRDPGPLPIQHWVCGPGGCDRTPVPPFTFIQEEMTGSNPKVKVRDAQNRVWSVKFGVEAIPECFASRFVTAVGYLAEPTYFVAAGKIEGLGKLRRARWMVKKDGSFTKARFELRGQEDLVFLAGQSWAWNDNPFRGSREFAGLKIVTMLLSDWDAADAREGGNTNNAIFRRPGPAGPELAYGVYDWGDTLGHWGGVLRRASSDCSSYAFDTPHFIKGVRQNQVEWGFAGKHADDLKSGISVDDVRWLLPYLLRITPEQLRTGLTASGATGRQTSCWAAAIQNRIAQLQAIAKN